MGQDIASSAFTLADFQRFSERLVTQMAELRGMLARPGFGEGERTIGGELELCIIDRHGHSLPVNRALLAHHLDPNLTVEIDRFNLEYNCTPVAVKGGPFSAMQLELHNALASINRTADQFDARVVPVGILPTLTERDLRIDALTDLPRYRALNEGLQRLRQAPFAVRIDGEDPLALDSRDITLEGANTSFQVHLRVAPDTFADTYNAAQLATPVALALAANSPIFLGHQLWDETRVALFKQSLDVRDFDTQPFRPPARVGFGHGWVRRGALELFEEAVALFPPLLPILTDPGGEIDGRPVLRELRLHQSTVWRWNRAVYDHSHGGHLRIEMRALPAGPTPLDMAANAAFLVGLTEGLRPRVNDLLPGIPFAIAEWNFYRAAQAGVDARLAWPVAGAPSPRERGILEIAKDLLPVAEEGLESLGVDGAEVSRLMRVIRERIATKQTGARWLRRGLDRARRTRGLSSALADVVDGYVTHATTGRPVHEWEPLAV